MLTPEQSKQAAEEFKALFKRLYGVELSDEEATEQSGDMLTLFAGILGYSE